MNRLRMFALSIIMISTISPAVTQASTARQGIGTAYPTQHFANPIERAFTYAGHYWRTEPCGGDVSMEWGAMAPHEEVAAQFMTRADHPNRPFNCLIQIATHYWPSYKKMSERWPAFCLTIVHAFGALLQKPDSHNPHSVMYLYQGVSAIPRICQRHEPITFDTSG